MHVVMAIGRRKTKAILIDVCLLLCTAECAEREIPKRKIRDEVAECH